MKFGKVIILVYFIWMSPKCSKVCSSRKLIVCDIDGVILDFGLEIEKRLGYKLNGYNETDDVIRIVNEIHNDEGLVKLTHYYESKKYFNLISQTYNIVLLTAVPKEFNDKRKKSLNGYNYINIQNAKSEDKWKIVKTLNPVIIIEDRPDTIKDLTLRGYIVYYPTFHEYTKDLKMDGAYGFKSWKDLYQIICTENRKKNKGR